MKKRYLLLALPLLIIALVSTSYGWQGRMGGMGDPYGLLEDESDFLIHPAKIAQGEGIRYYGHYRFTYTDVMSWDYDLDWFTPTGVLIGYFHFDTSGQEYNHNALLGAATPLGPGRFGIFFTYDGMRGDYDGNENVLGLDNFAEYELTKDLDNFALRLLYGLPVLGMDVGLELGAAYRDEEKQWVFPFTTNDVWPTDYTYNLHFFMNPYDSNYWEILWKAGLGREFNAASFNWTIRGSNIISSNNEYEYIYGAPVPGEQVVMKGNVTGFSIGSDLWFRYQMNDSLTLPFVVSVDYTSKHRDGDGIGSGTVDLGEPYTYAQKEMTLDAKVGGGVGKKLHRNGMIGAALYYHYLQGEEDQWFNNSFNLPGPGYHYLYDYAGFPLHKEHRLAVRFAGELELSPSVTLRMGLNPFYGWVVAHDFEQSSNVFLTDTISLNGYTWGIGGSVGGSLQFDGFTMEPFINAGWQQYNLAGDGDTTALGVITTLWDMDLSRDEWYIGGGCSFLYDLP